MNKCTLIYVVYNNVSPNLQAFFAVKATAWLIHRIIFLDWCFSTRGNFALWGTFGVVWRYFLVVMSRKGAVGIYWVSEAAKCPAGHRTTSRNKESSGLKRHWCQGWEILFWSQVRFLLFLLPVFSTIKTIKIIKKFLVPFPRTISISNLFFILLVVVFMTLVKMVVHPGEH